MNKVSLVRLIVKLYFVGALAGSFIHLVTAAHKLGLADEAYAIPFMIDGVAIIGIIMRCVDFSTKTRKIGFRTQMFAGAISLAGNVYAASSIGGVLFGIGIVALFLFAEWLSDNIESAEAEAKRNAEIEKAAAKAKSIDQARRTRERNKRKNRVQAKALDELLIGN